MEIVLGDEEPANAAVLYESADNGKAIVEEEDGFNVDEIIERLLNAKKNAPGKKIDLGIKNINKLIAKAKAIIAE